MVTLLYIGFTLGFIIGVVLTALVSSLSVPDGNLHLYTSGFSDFIKNPVSAFFIHSFACGILGMIIGGSMIFYEIDEWGLSISAMAHFLVSIISFYLAAFFLRWFRPTDLFAICTSFAMFVINYTCIWFIQYLSCKRQVAEINQKLNLRKKEYKKL